MLANGFAYLKKRELTNSIQWECELRRKKQECKHRAWTSNGQIIKESDTQHIHGPNLELLDKYKISMQIKEEARANTESTTQRVLSKVIADADTDCSSKLPTIKSMKRKIRRIRQEERDCPAIPHDTDFDIALTFVPPPT